MSWYLRCRDAGEASHPRGRRPLQVGQDTLAQSPSCTRSRSRAATSSQSPRTAEERRRSKTFFGYAWLGPYWASQLVRPLSLWPLPSRARPSVLPILHQVIHHRRVGQRRGIAERAVFVLGDLAQDAAHDLAGAGLRQAGGELDEIRRGDRADLLAHPADQFLAQVLRRLLAAHQRHVGIDALALDVMRIADYGGFRDLGMRDQCAFDLGGAEPVAGDIDHVVDPAGDPVVSVGVAPAAVAGEVLAGIGLEIRVDKTLVVAVDGAHLARPRVGE